MKLTRERLDEIKKEAKQIDVPRPWMSDLFMELIAHAEATIDRQAIGQPWGNCKWCIGAGKDEYGNRCNMCDGVGRKKIIEPSSVPSSVPSRAEIASRIMAGFAADVDYMAPRYSPEEIESERPKLEKLIAATSVRWADFLIAELKKQDSK